MVPISQIWLLQQTKDLMWFQALNQLEIPHTFWEAHHGPVPDSWRVEIMEHVSAGQYDLLEHAQLRSPWQVLHEGMMHTVAQVYDYDFNTYCAEGFIIFPLGVIDLSV